MTYKNSNWTRGELGHDPIRNPRIECPQCGDSYWYEDYWVPRYVDGKDWNPREVTWLCDNCLDEIYAEYERVRREESHKQLSEFASG